MEQVKQNGYKNGICRKCLAQLPSSCIKNKKNNCGRSSCQTISVSQILLNMNEQSQKEIFDCFEVSNSTQQQIFKDYSDMFNQSLQSSQYQKLGILLHKHFENSFQEKSYKDDFLSKVLGQNYFDELQKWIEYIKPQKIQVEITINDRNVYGKPDLIIGSRLYDYKFYNHMTEQKQQKCLTQLLLYVMILATYGKTINIVSIFDLKRGKILDWTISNIKMIKVKQFLKQYSQKQIQLLPLKIHSALQELFSKCANIIKCRVEKDTSIKILYFLQQKLNYLGIPSKILFGNSEMQTKKHYWLFIDQVHLDLEDYIQNSEFNMLQTVRYFDIDCDINPDQMPKLEDLQIINLCDQACEKIKQQILQESKFKQYIENSRLKNKESIISCFQEQNDLDETFEQIFRKQWIIKFGQLDLSQKIQKIDFQQNAYRYSQSIQFSIDFSKQPPPEIVQIIEKHSLKGQLKFRKFCEKQIEFYVDRIENVHKINTTLPSDVLWEAVCCRLRNVGYLKDNGICKRFTDKYDKYLQQIKNKDDCELCGNMTCLQTKCCERKMCPECDYNHLTVNPCQLCGSKLTSRLLDKALQSQEVQRLQKHNKQKEISEYVQYLVSKDNKIEPDMQKAYQMYEKCKEENKTNQILLNPYQWLENKQNIKKIWQDIKTQSEEQSQLYKEIIYNNSFGQYMEYMNYNF